MELSTNVYRVLVGRTEAKRLLWKPRRRWEVNIKMDLREVGCAGDWIDLAQDRVEWRVYGNGGNEPPGFLKAIS